MVNNVSKGEAAVPPMQRTAQEDDSVLDNIIADMAHCLGQPSMGKEFNQYDLQLRQMMEQLLAIKESKSANVFRRARREDS